MNLGEPPALIDGKLPVFVFPTSVTFYSDDQSSHKQVLTLYNPYEFPLKFKVLCTTPRKYTVVDSEGIIKARCCVDIVIRHTDICINNEGVRDKFRIQVTEHGQRKVIGKKDIPSVLLPTKDKAQVPEEQFEQLPLSQTKQVHESQHSLALRQDDENDFIRVRGRLTSGPSVVVILAAIVCIVALMLPTTGDTQSRLPDYLFLSMNQKLIAAYILGLVTMAILRS